MKTNKAEEQSFHDAYVTNAGVRSLESRFYCDTAREREYKISFEFLGDLKGKRLLFYGSGGHFSLIRKFVNLGAQVVAIDISPETISKLAKSIEAEGLQHQCQAQVMDCESLSFRDESFDMVFARSIIHHLDIGRALSEICRVLKQCGKFTVLEPLGTNPIINLYRRLTPDSRTSGEHPLLSRDIVSFATLFRSTKAHYLYCFSLLAYLYRMIDRNEARFEKLFHALCSLDGFLLKIIPRYRYLCWDVLLCCEK